MYSRRQAQIYTHYVYYNRDRIGSATLALDDIYLQPEETSKSAKQLTFLLDMTRSVAFPTTSVDSRVAVVGDGGRSPHG